MGKCTVNDRLTGTASDRVGVKRPNCVIVVREAELGGDVSLVLLI